MSDGSTFPDDVLGELRFLRRRVAELERRELERDGTAEGSDLFRRLVEHSLGLMCVHDLEGNLLFVNAAAALTLGFHPEDGVGWNLRRFLSASVEDDFDAYLERIKRNGVDTGLMRLAAKNGTERIWLYRNVLYQEPGLPPRVLGHAQDVTERVRTEHALKESERRFRLLADTAPVLIWMTDANGACTFVNSPWLEFTGGPLEAHAGSGWTKHVHPEDRDGFVATYLSAVATKSAFRTECRLRRAAGEYRWMLCSGVPRTEGDAVFAGLIGSCVDVTEARQARDALEATRDDLTALVATRTDELRRSHEHLLAELRHRAQTEHEVSSARRLESLAVLASGMAHEFNNLLTVILGHVQLLLDRLRADTETCHELDLIRSSAERVAQLTQQLLAFGGKHHIEPQRVDLNRLLSELPLAAIAGHGVELTLCLDPTLRPPRVDTSQLGLVIMRLVETGRDAMPAGGPLVVETANVDVDSVFLDRFPDASASPYVRITIRDRGRDPEAASLPPAVEPFFNARRMSHGRDVALAAVYGIIRQHGGHVSVDKEPGGGTAFSIYLPAEDDDPLPGAQPESSGDTPTSLLLDGRGIR